MVRRYGFVCLLILVVGAGAATAGAPTVAGPTRGGLNIVLPYYPTTPRSGALGLATVALADPKSADSHNPAALGFLTVPHGCFQFDYGRMNFDHGPDLDIYHGDLILKAPMVGGYARVMGMAISTREQEMSRMGGVTHVWGREFGLAYGREIPLPEKIPGRVAFGFAGYPNDQSELRLTAPGGPTVATGRGQSQIGSMRLGMIYQVPIGETVKASVGVQFDHIKDWLRQRALVPGVGYVTDDGHFYVNLWTVGAAVHPDDKTTVLVQHLTGRASGPNQFDADFDIFSCGIERKVPVSEEIALALRAGVNDSHPTFGLGVTLPHGFHVDYSLLSNYGEQVKRAFGHGTLHLIGVGKSF